MKKIQKEVYYFIIFYLSLSICYQQISGGVPISNSVIRTLRQLSYEERSSLNTIFEERLPVIQTISNITPLITWEKAKPVPQDNETNLTNQIARANVASALKTAIDENRIIYTNKSFPEQVQQYAATCAMERHRPFLEPEAQKNLVERISNLTQYLREVISSITPSHLEAVGISAPPNQIIQRLNRTRFGLLFDDRNESPFISRDEVLGFSVTIATDTTIYPGFTQTGVAKQGERPLSIYVPIKLVEEYRSFESEQKEARDAFIYKLLRLLQPEINENGIQESNSNNKARLEQKYDRIALRNYDMKQQRLEIERKKREEQKIVAEITSVNIAKFLKTDVNGNIPNQIINYLNGILSIYVKEGLLVDFIVFANGGDIHIYTTRSAKDYDNKSPEVVFKLILAVTHSLEYAKRQGITKPDFNGFDNISFEDTVKELEIRRTYTPLKIYERKTEPIAVISASGVYSGALNILIWRFLCDPMTNAGQTIDPAGVPGYVFKVWDSEEDKIYLFDNREMRDFLLRVHISEPGRYVIVAAYTKEGHKIPSDEPILTVSTYRPFDDGKTPVGDPNPVLIVRAQSGLPAWGEIIESFGTDMPPLSYGGELDPNIHFMRPTGLNDQGPESRLVSRLAGFGYQSHGGKIGKWEEIAADKTLERTRKNADELNRILTNIPPYLDHMFEFEPFRRPHKYDRFDNVINTRRKLDKRFVDIPDPKKNEDDPILKKGDLTTSTIKADIGSIPGHYKPAPYMIQGAKDLLLIAKRLGYEAVKDYLDRAHKAMAEMKDKIEKGMEISADEYADYLHRLAKNYLKKHLKAYKPKADEKRIIDYYVWHIGDDIQLTILHKEGAESSDFIHPLARITFEYAKLVSELAKPYALGQDLLVTIDKDVSGNIQGAGPGYAEISLKNGDSVLNISADKTAPGAFSAYLVGLIRKALSEGRFQKGLIVEIWDIENRKRTFLDMTDEQDFKDAVSLLSATEEFAIKRVWTTTEKWDRKRDITEILSPLPIVCASTERLVLITGGIYVGKDDPTIYIKISEDGETAFTKKEAIDLWKYPYIVIGFMRGSHIGPLMPDKVPTALPHRFDGPPPLGGYVFNNLSINKGDHFPLSRRTDAFDGRPWLKETQRNALFITSALRAMGFMPPHKAEGSTEYTTAPQVKMILDALGKNEPSDTPEYGIFKRAASLYNDPKARRQEPVRLNFKVRSLLNQSI